MVCVKLPVLPANSNARDEPSFDVSCSRKTSVILDELAAMTMFASFFSGNHIGASKRVGDVRDDEA